MNTVLCYYNILIHDVSLSIGIFYQSWLLISVAVNNVAYRVVASSLQRGFGQQWLVTLALDSSKVNLYALNCCTCASSKELVGPFACILRTVTSVDV